MPTYQYKREDGTTFEIIQKISADALSTCPETGQKVKRIITGGGGVVYKGTGWYVTDYKNKTNGSSNGSSSGNDQNENGPANMSKSSPEKNTGGTAGRNGKGETAHNGPSSEKAAKSDNETASSA